MWPGVDIDWGGADDFKHGNNKSSLIKIAAGQPGTYDLSIPYPDNNSQVRLTNLNQLETHAGYYRVKIAKSGVVAIYSSKTPDDDSWEVVQPRDWSELNVGLDDVLDDGSVYDFAQRR